MISLPPVWLLDVDGVINATKPGWGAAPCKATVYVDGHTYTFRWAPALIDRIRKLHKDGTVELRWCTTWCAWADQLERMWLLPPLGRAFNDPTINFLTAPTAKLAAARRVLADRRRLIWTDDTETPTQGPVYDELTAGGRALLIAPHSGYGLQPEHLDTIEQFATTSADAT